VNRWTNQSIESKERKNKQNKTWQSPVRLEPSVYNEPPSFDNAKIGWAGVALAFRMESGVEKEK
jgi:hypothetical protein